MKNTTPSLLSKSKILILVLILAQNLHTLAQSPASTVLPISGFGNEIINAMEIDAQGNIIAVGNFNNTLDLDPSSNTALRTSFGQSDAFLVKLDSSGNFLWGKQLGGPAGDFANAVQVDELGNIYVAGLFEGTADFEDGAATASLTSRGELDVFLCKFSPQGSLLWRQQIGDSLKELSPFLNYGQDNHLYLTASFEGTVDFDPGAGIDTLGSSGQQDIFLLKLDSSGAFIWVKQLEGLDYQYSGGLAADSAGNVYITGSFVGQVNFNAGASPANVLTSQMGTDIFLAKYNSNSDLVWVHGFGSLGFEIGTAVILDEQNNPVMAGSFDNSIDFDPSSANFTLSSQGSRDVVVAKYSSTGALIWAKNAGGTAIDFSTALSLGKNGEIYCSGSFANTADFDLNTTQVIRNSNGNSDAFLWQLSSQGNFLNVLTAGGTKADQGNAVATNANGQWVWGGSVLDSAIFSDGSNNQKFICQDIEDAFIYGSSLQTVGLESSPISAHEIQIFPNPSQGNISILLKSKERLNMSIIDTQGKVIWRKQSNESLQPLELDLPAGMYFLQINHKKQILTKKLIIQP